MSVLPTAEIDAAHAFGADIGRLYCWADRSGEIRTRDGSSGAGELRDRQCRLAPVLPRDGSRHGETIARRARACAASSYRRSRSRPVARRGRVCAARACGDRRNCGARTKSAGSRRQRALPARDPRRNLSADRLRPRRFATGWRKSRRSSASRIFISSCARSIPRRRIESASTTCTESCERSKSSS